MKIIKLGTTDSTNTKAKLLATNGESEWTIVTAERQTSGKGRLTRSFFSPDGGLYMSIILRPSIRPESATFITTAAAVAVSRAIDEVFCVKTQIKWVNDIFLENKKVCGILTEASFNHNSGMLDFAILGIGVNTKRPDCEIPDDIKDIAGFLSDDNCQSKKELLFDKIIAYFKEYYDSIEERIFINEYRKRLMLIGKRITVIKQDETSAATAIDIDNDMRLIVEYEDGRREALLSGEVSVRL